MDIKDVTFSGGMKPIEPAKPSQVQSARTGAGTAAPKSMAIVDRADINRIAKEDVRILEGARLVLDAMPDIRQDKVKLARERLRTGYYDSSEVKAEIAKSLTEDSEAYPVMTPMSERETDEIQSRINQGTFENPDIKGQIADGMIEDAMAEE